MEAFLEKYIGIWNGIDFVDEIFELLTYVRPLAFEGIHTCPDQWYLDILIFFIIDLEYNYLKPLYHLFCVSDVMWKASSTIYKECI